MYRYLPRLDTGSLRRTEHYNGWLCTTHCTFSIAKKQKRTVSPVNFLLRRRTSTTTYRQAGPGREFVCRIVFTSFVRLPSLASATGCGLHPHTHLVTPLLDQSANLQHLPKVIRDSNPRSRINPDSDPDVCRIAAKMLWIH